MWRSSRPVVMLVLIAFALTGCATVGATEGKTETAIPKTAVHLSVDNNPAVDVEGVVVDGRLYLPVETLAGAVNRSATWSQSDGALKVYQRPAIPDEPAISPAPAGFSQEIKAALATLQAKDPARYKTVTEYVQLIVPGKFNAAYPEANSILVVEGQSPTWLVGVLAHEAEHLRIDHEEPNTDIVEGERAAYKVSLEVLKATGAPAAEIANAEQSSVNPPTWETVAK